MPLRVNAQNCLHQQLMSFDKNCQIEVKWIENENSNQQVNGVLIRWSLAHYTKLGIEPELFVDIMSLIFSD